MDCDMRDKGCEAMWTSGRQAVGTTDVSLTSSADTSRRYNKADHPIAFHKGDMFAMAKKKIADIGPAPDNDEVFEVGRRLRDGKQLCAPVSAPFCGSV